MVVTNCVERRDLTYSVVLFIGECFPDSAVLITSLFNSRSEGVNMSLVFFNLYLCHRRNLYVNGA